MSSNGWVKDYRSKLEWPWFSNPPVAHLWEYLLLKATHTARRATAGNVGVDLLPGQLIFGRRVAAEQTGLSEQNVRTGIQVLIREKSIKYVHHSTKQFSIITILNWDRYQGDEDAANQPINQPLTNLQPTFNQPPTTDKNVKKGKKVENDKNTSSAAKAPAKPRKANPWWDTVCEVFGLTPITKADKSRIGRLSRDFKAKAEYASLGPEEIGRRRSVLAGKWNDWDKATPEAVLKWWDVAGGNGHPMITPLPSDQERAREAQAIEDQERAARRSTT